MQIMSIKMLFKSLVIKQMLHFIIIINYSPDI